jgi:hypothetical protein
MLSFAALWLPIVLSAVIVFVASSLMHMLFTYHKNDYRKLPEEDKLLAALRPSNLKPGLYVFPYCLPKDMKSPEITEKYKQGPVGFMTIIPNGPPAMPKLLALWFSYCLLISIFISFLVGPTFPPGAPHRLVFHVTGLAAFLAYGLSNLINGIWKGQRWSATIKDVFDGLVYALLTGVTFAWLWPH